MSEQLKFFTEAAGHSIAKHCSKFLLLTLDDNDEVCVVSNLSKSKAKQEFERWIVALNKAIAESN